MDDISVTSRAYEILRHDLISCRLKPGSRLNVLFLRRKLSLSQASVREALSRLTAEGLVEIHRGRGFRATPVSMRGFRELAHACMMLEMPGARVAIAKGGREWELSLVSAYHRAVRTLELVVLGQEDITAYAKERQAYYEALLGACDNTWLIWAWRLLYAQYMRYRHMYIPLAKFELDMNPHHEAFLKAVLARDVDKALALWASNYDMVANFIESLAPDTPAKSVTKRAPKRPL